MIVAALRARAPHVLTDTEHLLANGYLILERAVEPRVLEQARDDLADGFARAPFCAGLFYGEITKRFGRLLARLSDPDAFVLHKRVLAIIHEILGGAGSVQLNLTQAIEIHPGARAQVPHRDHDMWRFTKNHGMTYMINVMWALDDFTFENGATKLWPHSNYGDLGLTLPPEDEAIAAVAPAGSAIIFLGQTLHAGGANRSDRPRRGMIVSYCLDWLLPDENPWLAYPPDIARRFSSKLAELAGYRQRFAGLNNFEGRDPAVLLGGAVPDYLQFTDDMSSDQTALIQSYYAGLDATAVA